MSRTPVTLVMRGSNRDILELLTEDKDAIVSDDVKNKIIKILLENN